MHPCTELAAARVVRMCRHVTGASACHLTPSLTSGDSKDTADFKYTTYPARPAFTPEHKSLMAKFLTPEMWEKLKDKKTAMGYTLSNAIQTGVDTPHLGVGITAGDEESWETFKDIYYPIIKVSSVACLSSSCLLCWPSLILPS